MRKILYLLPLLLVFQKAAWAADRQHFEWVGNWAAAPLQLSLKQSPADSTFRNVIHLSIGGSSLRVTLTNQFGTAPLHIGDAHVALSAGQGRIQAGSDHPLTFNGQPSVMIPAGSYVLSDPVAMTVADFADLAISLYLPQQDIATPTCHQTAMSTNYVAQGDVAGQQELQAARTESSWCFLQEVAVQPSVRNSSAVVTMGDSITDGARSTVDANRRYPDDLAQRFHANRKTAHLAVLNEGISGGRVLYEGHGPSALARFDRDVLAQPGVRYLIYLEGINDIGQLRRADSPENNLTTQDLIFGATQLVLRAHQHGIKVFGATLTPFGPAKAPDTPEWLHMRQLISEYNDWVRTSKVFDGVADFNRALADPQNPQSMLPAFDSGDHVHPSDAGYKAMADSIDLKDFTK